MFLFLFIGFIFGGGLGWFFWWTSRRELTQLDEEKQLLNQEKMIVLDFMHNMVEAIGDGLNRKELFQRVVHSAILSTGALSACIFERNGDKLQGVAVEGLFPPHRALPESIRIKITTRSKFIEQILRSEVFSVGEGLVGASAQSGEGVLIEDARNDPRVIRHDDPSLEVRSVIVVPISFKERNIAVLAIVNPSDGGTFGEADFSLAQGLAEQAGLAIHNLDLMALQIEKNKLDVDLSLAREIQSMLLPKSFPENELLDFAAVYKPAQKVGGDLYDIFPVDENRVGIAIADVSGKGVAASLLMAICQTNLRHMARLYDSPSQVLQGLNSLLHVEMKPDMFVTIVYAVIDTAAGKITFARGGHELPILLHSEEEGNQVRSHLLRSEGMALGMVPKEVFDHIVVDKTIDFKSGDIFNLYTDGVTEAVNAQGVEFSNSRLMDTIRTLRHRDAQRLNRGILDKVEQFAGKSGQTDDITLLTVKHR